MFTNNNNNTNPPTREQQRTLFGFCGDAVWFLRGRCLVICLTEIECKLARVLFRVSFGDYFLFFGAYLSHMDLRDLCGKNQQQHTAAAASSNTATDAVWFLRGRCLVICLTEGHIMAVPCVPDVPQIFKFFEKIFGKRDMGHMKNHIMAVPHVPKSSKFLIFFFFYMKKFAF